MEAESPSSLPEEVTTGTIEALLAENKSLRQRVAELEAELQANRQTGSQSTAPSVDKQSAADKEPGRKERQNILRHLREQACVKLAPSPIAGVGVFAFRHIPAGTDPFVPCNEHFSVPEKFSICSEHDFRDVPDYVVEEIKSFFAPMTEDDGWKPQKDVDGHTLYGVLTTGMASLNVSWYLNHSDDPNMSFQDAEEDGRFNSFVTKRAISQGEELTIDYRELGKGFYEKVAGPSD